jgi:protein-disulfide isomerase
MSEIMSKALFVFLIFFAVSGFCELKIYKTTPAYINFAGEANATIDVTAFVSSGCPSCKEAVIMLYELSSTAYKGKIKVSIKPLYKQLGDIALIAANNQNRSWELFRAYANTGNRISSENINGLFDEAKIDKNRIYEDMRDTALIYSVLEANYTEAKKCGMNFTPHILFNGIIYEGEIKPKSILEYIENILAK